MKHNYKFGGRPTAPSRRSPSASRRTLPKPHPVRRKFAPRRWIDPAVVFEDLLPDLRQGSNGFAWACCPFHDDSNPSFCVNLRTGWYRCFSTSCGSAGVNIVGFVGSLLALSTVDARRHLEAHYG
jgi:hypothetical protein